MELRMIFTLANGKQASVRTFGGPGGTVTGLVAATNTLHTAIGGAWSTRLSSYLTPTVRMDAITVRDMTSHLNPEFRSTNAATPSGGSGEALPQDVAAVLTAEGDDRGRGAKGTLCMSGLTEVSNAGGWRRGVVVQTALNKRGNARF